MEWNTMNRRQQLTHLLQCMVDDEEELRVEEQHGDLLTVLAIAVAPSDVGQVLGKCGRNIDALRRLINGPYNGVNYQLVLPQGQHRRSTTPQRKQEMAPKSMGRLERALATVSALLSQHGNVTLTSSAISSIALFELIPARHHTLFQRRYVGKHHIRIIDALRTIATAILGRCDFVPVIEIIDDQSAYQASQLDLMHKRVA